jgi:hypothetical protein
MVSLCESKKAKDMDELKWSIGFEPGVALYCICRSGGVALWWGYRYEVTVRTWCQYYIDAKIEFEGKPWRFSGIF